MVEGARWGVVLGGRAVEWGRAVAVEDDTTDDRAVVEGGETAVGLERVVLDDRVAVCVITVVVVVGIKFRCKFLSGSTGERADGGTADNGRV